MDPRDRAPAPDDGAGAAHDDARYSVALCTYRGASFVAAQLDSIFAARPACSELVVIDDASGDATMDVLHRTIGAWSGRAVLEVNPVNRGSLRSFEHALRQTSEPIVFLADQDDLWRRDKPARMLAQFAARPDLLLLHSDARIVDDTMRPLGYTLLNAIEASRWERATVRHGDAFDTFVRRNIATGATIAMRRSLLAVALPIPDGWVHDEWLATIASAIGTVDYLDEPLIDYRQHANNQIGARKLSWHRKLVKVFAKPGDYYAKQLGRATSLLERLESLGPRVPADRVEKVRQKLAHLRVRATLPTSRLARLGPIGAEWRSGSYRRYSTGLKSLMRDLFHSV